jgi:serine phosphatase RsbU (regulator of sigma subunit)
MTTGAISVRGTDEVIQLQQKLARVQSLLEAARRVHSKIRLDDVLRTILELAVKELECHGSFIAPVTRPLEAQRCSYGLLPDDWAKWTQGQRKPGYAGVPLSAEDGETMAYLVVYRPAPLSLEEEDFLEGLALQSALALQNARHHQQAVEWGRVQLDLEAARDIQRSLLPQSVPEIHGYSLSVRSTPCYEVGGDYVDIVPLADGRLMMVLADVAGKGLASALFSMTFRSSFRAICGSGLPLAGMAARLNQLHWQDGVQARHKYVTAILACLYPRTHRLEAVNAGHTPAFLAGCSQSVQIRASGPPLGMFPDSRYETVSYKLQECSQVLLYTDGLTEVFQGEEEFGEGRLLGLLNAAPGADFLDRVWTTLAQFAGDSRQSDDMTALYLRRAGDRGWA